MIYQLLRKNAVQNIKCNLSGHLPFFLKIKRIWKRIEEFENLMVENGS